MKNPAFSPGDVDEAPVPLVAPSLGAHEVERPVDLTERERILKDAGGATEDASDHPHVVEARPGEPGRRPVRATLGGIGRHRRALGAALLAAACLGAFAHGWHVGSGGLRSAASNESADVVNHITYQEEEGR